MLTQDAAVVEAAPPRVGEIARAVGAVKWEERVDEGMLTRDAAVVEAASPQPKMSRRRHQRRAGMKKWMKAVDFIRGEAIEAAPPRTDRRNRTGGGSLWPSEAKQSEIRSRRSKLTRNAVVVEAASPEAKLSRR